MGEVRAVKWEKSLENRLSTEEMIAKAANSVEIGYNPNRRK